MSTLGKPDPGVPDVRAAISRKQEAMGLPPLAPATDTADNERPLSLAEAAAALTPPGPPGRDLAPVRAVIVALRQLEADLATTAAALEWWLAQQSGLEE